MVLPRICVLYALVAWASSALAARQEIPEQAKPRVEYEEERKGSLDDFARGWRAVRTESMGQHVKISTPDLVRRNLAAVHKSPCRTDGIRKPMLGQRKLTANAKSSKRKVNPSRACLEHEDHHKLPHDVSNKCSLAKKEKMKAKDIQTKHGELAEPPAKNGVAKGCGDATSSTTTLP